MKARVLNLLLCAAVLLAGCNTTAWYQSGKTLAQASKDCEQCKYEVMKHHSAFSQPQTSVGYMVGADTEMLMQCMKLQGYIWSDVTDAVKSGRLRVQMNSFDPWYSVAGD